MATFKSSDAPDFELPDEDVYIFQVTHISAPEIIPNKWYKEGEPESKREKARITVDCTIFKSVGGDDEWAGSVVKVFSYSSNADGALGTVNDKVQFPTKLRVIVEAVLGRKITDDEEIDERLVINGYFQGTVVHKNNWANIETPIPYKAQGTGQGGRRRNAPPPPPPSVPTDDEFDPGEFADDAEMAS